MFLHNGKKMISSAHVFECLLPLVGSASLLSESMHSLADLGNQVLLAVGLQQSLRRADETRPYGYGYEQYVWAMISGVSLSP